MSVKCADLRVALLVSLFVCGLSRLWPCVAFADAQKPTAGLARVERFLARAAPNARVELIGRVFLVEGEQRVWQAGSERAACYGYFAVGTGDVRDVDLALHAQGGQALDEDLGASPYAYARACLAKGTPFSVSAALYAGRGELLLFRIADAPRNLGLPPAELVLAVAAGGRLEPTREIGRGPDGPSIATQFVREERVLADEGYASAGPAITVDVRASAGLAPLSLSAGRCYRVLVQVPGVSGLMIEVVGPDGNKVEARSASADHAAAAICPAVSGEHIVRVLVRPFRAIALVRAFEHPFAHPEPGVDANLLLRAAEARFAISQRALEPRLLGEAWVEPHLNSTFAFSVDARRCYALSAVSADEAAGLDLRLLDTEGRLVARNEARGRAPLLVHCTERAGTYRLNVVARGRAQRVLSYVGSEP